MHTQQHGATILLLATERTNETEADGRSAIGDRRAASDDRRPVRAGCPGRCTGAVPACGLWFYFSW
jgi:hypothetical protein